MSKNQLSGVLTMPGSIGTQLQTVDLQENIIVDVAGISNYKKTLL
jgi:hypothetical protein